ncbi:winged helix-turn-helix domain-containing protein [Variovorax atrisoli]|uniref:winged helix-turn-helix domain-containing protein n=1 Tax=Variovorax atrisoli TaxID=3394203 RepID=UPI0012FD660D|nr:response regulator transcription factor [Variovorax paradoxus]
MGKGRVVLDSSINYEKEISDGEVYELEIPSEKPTSEAGWRIAVLTSSDPDRDFVTDALHQVGHAVIKFFRLKDLAQALSVGDKFDLLMVAINDRPEAILAGSKFLRSLAGDSTAFLLLVHPEQLLENRYIVASTFSDFILMPCEDCELVARVMRAHASLGMEEQNVFTFGRYTFDKMSHTLSIEGRDVRLKPRQFRLALYLFRHANRAQSREDIFRAVWGKEHSIDLTRTIDVHIAHLRKLLMEMSSGDVSLISIRGYGYRLFLNTQRKPSPLAPLLRGANSGRP